MALLNRFKEQLTAQNVFLDENTGGKGKYFKARFLQPGLVKYSFGVCVLEKDTIDKFINEFVGCPVIIGHKDVTNENAKKLSCGNICHIWYDESDGWYWGDGIIDDEEAINKINQGYNVSCQYEITEYSNNTTNALHNGNPYDKVILNGKPEHLAIVDRPRYENAMIAMNALDLTAENEDKDIEWITIKGNHIPVKKGQSKEEAVKEFIESKKEQKQSDKKEDYREDDMEENYTQDYADSISKDFQEFMKSRKEEKQEPKQYGGLSEEEYTKISKEYQEIKKSDFLKPQHIKRLQEIYPYFIDDAEFSSQSEKFNEPTKEYYKKQIDKLKQGAEELKDWFDLSKHSEKHMSSEWKKYLKEHPEEFTNKASNSVTNVIKQAINEIKETDMFKKLFNKKEKKMEQDEMKSLFMECLQECLKAKNEEDEEDIKEKEEEKEAENKCKNEVVDKRDIIRQIMAIAGKEEASEDVKTIAKLAEKLAYDKSEADDKADNCKGKNEEKEEDEKEEAKNKAKNALEEMKALFSQTEVKKASSNYVSRSDAIELGNEIFG